MRISLHPSRDVSIVAIAMSICVTPALAQSSTVSNPGTPTGGVVRSGIEEIVVTAQKRSENLQDVPISISALSASALAERGLNNVGDIASQAPNLTLRSTAPFSGSSSILVAFIRGVGQNDFAFNLDPGVGLYLDGVYIARNIGANSELLDLERVEVLKGPQGTLFGRNTIGGAINIVTRDPSNKFRYRGEFTTGSFDRHDFRGSVDVPIVTDKLLTSFAFAIKRRDGYQRHIPYPGASGFVTDTTAYPVLMGKISDRSGNENQNVFRMKVLARPVDRLKITLVGDYLRTNEEATASSLINVNSAPPAAGQSPSLTYLYNTCIGTPASVIATIPALVGVCGPRGNPGSPTGVLPGLGGVNVDNDPNNNRSPHDNRFVTGDPDTTYAQGANFSKIKNYGVSGTIDYQISRDLSLKSITAYRHLKALYGVDNGGAPFTALTTTFYDSEEQTSQELQLIGIAFDNRWKFVLGGYYFHESGTDSGLVPLLGGLIQVNSVDNLYDTKAYAVFTHNNIDITDRFSLTLGARYTWEDKTLLGTQREENIFGIKIGLPVTAYPDPTDLARLYPLGLSTQSFHNFSFRFGAEYHLTRDVMTYASISNGFKSGGWTTRLTLPIGEGATAPEFKPEKATTYEVGVKTTMFDRRLRLNAAAFYTDYTDIQLVIQLGTTPTFLNGGNGRILLKKAVERAEPN